jgi:hypothetical protein
MNELNLTDNTQQLIGEMFRNRFGIILEELSQKNPKAFESILKEAVAQEAIKKFSFKGLFASLEKGGLFGRNGVFSFLGKTLFKKPNSTDLVAKPPLGRDGDTSIDTSSIVSSSPLQTNTRQVRQPREKDFFQKEVKPIPIEFDGFTQKGKDEFAEVLPPIFEDILKNVFKGEAFTSLLEGLQPEKEEEYGSGLIPGLVDFLGNLALGSTLLGGGKVLGKRGIIRAPLRRLRAGRIRAQRAGRTSRAPLSKTALPPPVVAKPALPPTVVAKPALPPTAAPAPAVKGATKAASSGALRGAVRGGARVVPVLGTVLTAGMLASDLSSVSEQEEKGEITQKEAYQAKGGAIGGAGGALAGAAAGAAIGAGFGGIGAIPGAIIGGILGSMAGGAGGEAIGSAMVPEEEQPIINPVSAPEIPKLDIPEPSDYSKTLQDISSNTKNTSSSISRLTDAIFTLATNLKTQPSNSTPNVAVINNQQSQTPSASQIAASNIDAIRSVRRQFNLA